MAGDCDIAEWKRNGLGISVGGRRSGEDGRERVSA
jgi:hypothetical protein